MQRYNYFENPLNMRYCLFSVTLIRCQQVSENSSWRVRGGLEGGISCDRLTGSALNPVTHRNHIQRELQPQTGTIVDHNQKKAAQPQRSDVPSTLEEGDKSGESCFQVIYIQHIMDEPSSSGRQIKRLSL